MKNNKNESEEWAKIRAQKIENGKSSVAFASLCERIHFLHRFFFSSSIQTHRVFISELDRLHSRAVLHGIALSSSVLPRCSRFFFSFRLQFF